jgi:putative transposase
MAPPEEQHRQAMDRFVALRPALEDGVPLTRAAADAGIPLRTAQRWLTRYRRHGLAGLARVVEAAAEVIPGPLHG